VSLRTRITIWTSLILGVVLAVGGWLIWRSMEGWAEKRLHGELAAMAAGERQSRLELAGRGICLHHGDLPALDLASPAVAAWYAVKQRAAEQGFLFTTLTRDQISDARPGDPFARIALEAFQRDRELSHLASRVSTRSGTVLRYAAPVDLGAACLSCHVTEPHGVPAGLRPPHAAFVVSAPLDSLVEAEIHVRRTALLVCLGAILVAAAAVHLTVRRLTQPLEEMAHAARHLGRGEWNQRVSAVGDDEVGVMGMAFNQMAESLQAHQDSLRRAVDQRTEELQRSQRQLLQAGKLASIGELASGVAHELNNPAGILLMRAARLADEDADRLSAEAVEDIDVIRRQVEKIRRIVSGLLTFSRRSSSELKPLEINAAVLRTLSLLGGILHSRNVDLQQQLSADLPLVLADSSQLEQVLLSLANNALDAMPEGGTLSFSTRCDRDGGDGPVVCVEVRDTGSGIAENHLARIFDPFFTTKEVGQGTGLGLSISYGIIEEHGGSISVDSKPAGGACFVVAFPAISGC
jgi:signal transduction histidine kinase